MQEKPSNFGFNFEFGFGLIEVLIALVVISVGLLGLASLNTNAYRLSLDSQWRMSAGYIAESMANRMKMNAADSRKGSGSAYLGGGASNDCSKETKPCTPVQMAQLDVFEMKQLAANLLPSGNVVVTGSTPVFTITVTWKGKDDVDRSYITSVRP